MLDGPGSLESCEGESCPGDFPNAFELTVRAGGPLETATLRFEHGVGSDVVVGPLPEPGSGAMLAAGALALAALRRRR